MNYTIGVTTIDITPPVGCHLAGFAARRTPSTGVYNPLRAVITMLADSETQVCLVSAEWLGFYDRTNAAREKISSATGIAPDRIFLFGTHTHYGPAIRQTVDARRHGSLDEEYVDKTLTDMADAARAAQSAMAPTSLATATGWCGFAASRRMPDGEGGVAWSPTLDAPHDHEVSILKASDEAGEVKSLIFSYACHPTSGGGGLNEAGGDYPGFALDYLVESLPGCGPCFLLGCAGDQKPNCPQQDSIGFRPLEVNETRHLGERLGRSTLHALSESKGVSGPLVTNQQTIQLEFTPIDDAALAEELQSDNQYVRARAEYLAGLSAKGLGWPQAVAFEIQTLRLGSSFTLVAMSGEICVEYALRLKRELAASFDHVMVVGYANEIIGYVPVKRQIPEGGYEVTGSNQHMLYPGPFAEDTEDRICAAVHQCLGQE